jgi:hypothetical protein
VNFVSYQSCTTNLLASCSGMFVIVLKSSKSYSGYGTLLKQLPLDASVRKGLVYRQPVFSQVYE